MKLAIVGYGKMGHLVEQLAPRFGFEVAIKLDEFNNKGACGITEADFRGIDVAIEFSVPDAAVANLSKLAALRVPVVVGTTGWLDHLDEVKAEVERHQSALVWSPNFSIGVQIFFRTAAEMAKLMAKQPDYGAWAWEIHHQTKRDTPSGTIHKLMEAMRQAGYSKPVNLSSNRAGAHPGTHEIGFDAPADSLTLRHTARSREGFARGALQAAQWIAGKQGFYEFSEILFATKRE
jgi:4-hydroxy-tetrahydrodipicolinate reductase